MTRPSSAMKTPTCILLLIATLGLHAGTHAQAAPRRSAFAQALRSMAAAQAQREPCEGGESASIDIPADAQLKVEGRALELPPREGLARRAAFVLVSTADTDANDAIAHRLFLSVLAREDGRWRPDGHREVPLDGASYVYEDLGSPSLVRIARTENVDGDDEEELFAVLQSDYATECPFGFCSRRRTLVFDLDDANPALTANIESTKTCQAEVLATERTTTFFRDMDDDGHADLVARRRICPERDFDEELGELAPQRCVSPVLEVHRWDPSTDRYVQVRP